MAGVVESGGGVREKVKTSVVITGRVPLLLKLHTFCILVFGEYALRWQKKGAATMNKNLLLVDLENVHKIDLSCLDESYRAIVFVGAQQNPPKAARKKSTAHRFTRVEFHKIEGNGKNALDFHIAFHLGRTIETAPDTNCIVLSKDKGFDPLLSHLNKNGLRCRRVSSLEELLPESIERLAGPDGIVCQRCRRQRQLSTTGGAGVPTAEPSPAHLTRACFLPTNQAFRTT